MQWLFLTRRNFLRKVSPLKNEGRPLQCLYAVGWGRDSRNEGFGDQSGIKYQLVSLITSVQTLLRGKFLFKAHRVVLHLDEGAVDYAPIIYGSIECTL